MNEIVVAGCLRLMATGCAIRPAHQSMQSCLKKRNSPRKQKTRDFQKIPFMTRGGAPIKVNGMDDFLLRHWQDLVGRAEGPLTFRLIIQPVMATLLAIRDGRRDAREKRAPYFWAIFTDLNHRRELLEEGWKAVVRVFMLAVIIDVIYQLIVFQWIYPLQALIVAFVLAFLPYLLLRGPVNRILRRL